jgi:hypothetical protein
MRSLIERYTVDRGSLARSYPVFLSPARVARFRQFYSEWLAQLQKLNFDSMSQEGKVDYLLLRNHLEYEMRQLDIQGKQLTEIQPLVPFLKTIVDLEEVRRATEFLEAVVAERGLLSEVPPHVLSAEAVSRPTRCRSSRR